MTDFWLKFSFEKWNVIDSDSVIKDPIVEIENAKSQKVQFSIRTNCNFSASTAFSPNKDLTLSFQSLNYFHILSIYSNEWWIAYQITDEPKIGFIPSFSNMKKLKQKSSGQKRFDAKNLFKYSVVRPVFIKESEIPTIYIFKDLRPKKKLKKSKYLSCIVESRNPYDIVPTVRPIIIFGPSLKHYEVTKILQQALIMNIISQFENKVLICEITNNLSDFNEIKIRRKKKTYKIDEQIKNEVNMILELCASDNLVIITGEQLNEPSFIAPIFDPIYFFVGINNEPLLDLLINKSGPGDNAKQTAMADRIINYDQRIFELRIIDTNMNTTCSIVTDYLQKYWKQTHFTTN